ncbi:NADH-quinone oxidoreductase subunit B family protein [Candidatus Venteria ishoeyi]|uniref:NAD-reducing hydrogenase HoxS subunit delta n=1 Tax=Candidatus Venteria ishoeyi TaxID=1899563 RepID=A0A1H6F9M0_9GAMM|nr:sulfhydrogenase subunit delta [Candidatus Venteria ishoeyi]MDM8547997.1 sulfhydrogenase subunit delta [Candidatus Venteria ishoeyi]SEH05846.1 NAD-reducing hydrogenase HoxS subunit delta [Candidatus Venteria ishoeyi]
MNTQKPCLAVHKFSSCDGCQLALLNLGEPLLDLAELIDIIHFAEAGPMAPDRYADIALVEGSVATEEDLQRIQSIRANTGFLISIGACATSGGVQALRNMTDSNHWIKAIYAKPEYISLLQDSTPIAQHVHVDFEIWGCPVNSEQVVTAVRDLLSGVKPAKEPAALCLECKRAGYSCVLVSKNEPCMGPVTLGGCGALCPSLGRACYSCYGPAELVNDAALSQRFTQAGLSSTAIKQRFHLMNSQAPAFEQAGQKAQSMGK